MKQITTDELRKMDDSEGLIIQGCGGDLQEWIDGVNEMLTKAEILQNGSKFENVSVFQNGDITNLLFDFEGVDIYVGKLAMWRLQTHSDFGGTWLSDYVPNRLGGFTQEQTPQTKPSCPLIEADGNIYNLMGMASRTLKEKGMDEQAKEMCEKVTSSGSYNEALCILGEYVNICSAEDIQQQNNMEMQGY